MKGALRVTITPADVGRRVSVRSRIDAAPGQPRTTDTVGRLLAWTDSELRIRRRDGTVVRLEEAALLAGKTLAEGPPRA